MGWNLTLSLGSEQASYCTCGQQWRWRSPLGYADDTNILANSLANLRTLNDWVHYFLRFNALRLNHSKCELVGRDATGLSVTTAAIAAAGITIEGHAIMPVAHDVPIRYLGVHCRFDGDWSAQHIKSTAIIQLFSRVVSQFKLSAHFDTSQDRRSSSTGNSVFVGSIKHAIASPLSQSLCSGTGSWLPSVFLFFKL